MCKVNNFLKTYTACHKKAMYKILKNIFQCTKVLCNFHVLISKTIHFFQSFSEQNVEFTSEIWLENPSEMRIGKKSLKF